MKAIDFKEVNVRIAENQDKYETLPAFYNENDGGMTFGFKLTDEEREEIFLTGEVWIKLLTFGKAMQPIQLSIIKEDLL